MEKNACKIMFALIFEIVQPMYSFCTCIWIKREEDFQIWFITYPIPGDA